MEQFGIWNLLKTMLNNSPSPSAQTAKTAETADGNTVNNAEPKVENEEKEPSFPQPVNACEEYLLRHERLHNQRKK